MNNSNNIISFPKQKKQPLSEKELKMESILKEIERRGVNETDMCISLIESVQDGLPDLFFAAEDKMTIVKNNLDLILYVLKKQLESKDRIPR